MIHSTTDEYVEEADYRRFESVAKEPKKLVLIDAKNHRFTDKMPQLKAQVLAGFAWFDNLSGPRPPSARVPSAAPRNSAPEPGLNAATGHGG
jgi:hypothetical protein